jgi:hypothetical protein
MLAPAMNDVNAISSNAPTIDLAAALDPASLSAWIEWSYASHAVHRRNVGRHP